MMIISSLPELFEALGRDPKEVLGTPESEWLDFKGDPYHLDSPRHCRELAKDVTAIANSLRPGVILLGVETELQTEINEELASGLSPIPDKFVDPKRIQDVVHAWVHPRLDIAVRRHDVGVADRHLWTIMVEVQRERDLPFILKREVQADRGSADDNAFSVFRRHSSHNVPYSPVQIHQWLHEGWTAAIGRSDLAVDDQSLQEKANRVLKSDLEKSGLLEQEYTYYFIQAQPTKRVTLSRFYEGASNSMFQVLQDPPQVRRAGFGFAFGERPERTEYDGLRSLEPVSACISITRSGLLTGILGQRYLTWGAERYAGPNQVWVNPIALVETTLEFWRLYFNEVLSRFDADPGQSLWRMGMAELGGTFEVALPQNVLGTIGSSIRGANTAVAGDFATEWEGISAGDAEAQAFFTLEEVYARFGYPSGFIPFTERNRISSEQIRTIHR